MDRPLALVIGAAGPIGQAAISNFSERYDVVATSRRGAAGLNHITPPHQALTLDALDKHSWSRLLQSLSSAPQIAVHCVGDFHLEPLDAMTPERFDAVVSSNLLSAFRSYHHLAPLLRQHQRSCLLYFGLAHGQTVQAEPRISAYYAAKQGLCSLVKSIAAMEAKNGLSCSLIAPGFVEGSPQPATTDQAPVPSAQLCAAIGQLTGPLAQQFSGTLLDLSGAWRLR